VLSPIKIFFKELDQKFGIIGGADNDFHPCET